MPAEEPLPSLPLPGRIWGSGALGSDEGAALGAVLGAHVPLGGGGPSEPLGAAGALIHHTEFSLFMFFLSLWLGVPFLMFFPVFLEHRTTFPRGSGAPS